ncbi:hypothetical protein CspHIS471_0212860 [Cutaneotrichosporon sp. HIS471]|nr:hypothetical protein CspHIS471_0212860 [Cutaneotrichosporon sp. HIS471]
MTEYHNTLSELTAPPNWRWSKIECASVTWDQQQGWGKMLVLPTIARPHWGRLGEEETIAAGWNRLNNKFKATQAEIAGYYRLPSLGSAFTADEAEDHLCLFEQRFILLAACGVKLTNDMKVGMFAASLPKDWDVGFLSQKRTWVECNKRFKLMTEPHNLDKKRAGVFEPRDNTNERGTSRRDREQREPQQSSAPHPRPSNISTKPKAGGLKAVGPVASSSKLGKAPNGGGGALRDADGSSSNRRASASGPQHRQHPPSKPTSGSAKPQTATSKFSQSNPFDILGEVGDDAATAPGNPTVPEGPSLAGGTRESTMTAIVDAGHRPRAWCSHCQVPGHHVSKCRRKAMGAPKRHRRMGEARKPPAAEEDGDGGPEILVQAEHLSLMNPADLAEACDGEERTFWIQAMELEIARLRKNGTIQDATLPEGQYASPTDWVYARQIKRDLAKFRCRVVGRNEDRVDTAAMGSMPALRVILAYGASVGMRFRHLSVDMSIPLPEPMYMTAPNQATWKVHKMLRGMKGSGKAIDRAIRDCLLACEFKKCKEGGVFVLPSPQGRPRAVLFQYGDELLVGSWTAGLKAVLPIIKAKFKNEGSSVDDLGEPALFLGLGIECFPHNCDVLLQQNHFIDHILDDVPELQGWGDRTTPLTLETLNALAATEPETTNPVDRKWWRKVLGQLSWLARCTRPDLAFAAAYLSRFSSSTTLGPAHRTALLDVLAYLRTRREFELKLGADEDASEPHDARAYSHGFVTASVDKSHIGWCLLLDGSTVDWASHKSNVAATELEADLVAQGEAAHRLAWLHDLLSELGVVASKHGVLFGDNCGVVDNQAALVGVLQANKHVLAEYQFMLDLESRDRLSLHGSGDNQPAKLCSMPITGSDFKRYCLMYGLERQLSISQLELMQGKTEEEALQHLLWEEEEGDVDVLAGTSPKATLPSPVQIPNNNTLRYHL